MMASGIGPPKLPDMPSSASTTAAAPVEAVHNKQPLGPQHESAAQPDAVRQQADGDEPRRETVAPQELEQALKSIRDYVQVTQRALDFSVDDSTGRIVVIVRNRETDEVVRQIPPAEALELARILAELDTKAGGEVVPGLLVEGEA